MSYSAPGPRRDVSWVVRRVQPPVERSASAPRSPLEPQQAQSAGTGSPTIDHLLRANEKRRAALRAEDEQLARAALFDVAADLGILLDSATMRVWQSGGKHARKKVKKIVKRDLAASVAAALPLAEIADLLELPGERVEVALRSLRAEGAMDSAAQDAALEQIRFLRAQLQLVVETQNHSLLDRLVAFIVNFAQALAIAAAAAAAGTLVVGGSPVPTEVIKALIIALVTMSLHGATKAVREKRSARNPYTVARETLADLSAELASFASTPGKRPAYALEQPILRIRLLVKTCKAQQALIEIQWEGKAICWDVLGELAGCLGQPSDGHAGELGQVLRKLRAVQSGIPSG